MAEFDIDVDALRGFAESGIDLRASEEAQQAIGNIREGLRGFGVELEDNITFSKSLDGDLIMKAGDREINLTTVSDSWREGNFEESLGELGIDTGTEEAKNFIQAQKDAFERSGRGKEIETMKEMTAPNPKIPSEVETAIDEGDEELKDAVAKAGGNPGAVDPMLKSFENLGDDIVNEASKKDPRVKASSDRLKDLQEQYREAKANGEDTSSLRREIKDEQANLRNLVRNSLSDEELEELVKKNGTSFGEKLEKFYGLAKLALLAVGIWLFVEFLKDLADSANGCWVINGSNKCKLRTLTCNDSDFSSGMFGENNFTECTVCDTTKCNTGDWIPLKKTGSCACNPNLDMIKGYDPNGVGSNNCVGGTNSSCPQTSVQIPSGQKSACPNANGCVVKSESCNNTTDGGNCSSLCSNDGMYTTSKIGYSCINRSPGSFIKDLPGDILNEAGQIWNKIEKALIYVAIGIAIILGLYFLVRLLDVFRSRSNNYEEIVYEDE